MKQQSRWNKLKNYNRETVIAKAEELAKILENTTAVNFYKQAEEKIHKNNQVTELIANIKRLQKEAVNLKHLGKGNSLKVVEDELLTLERQLDEIPIVQQFKQSQIEVNELLQTIVTTINDKLAKNITEQLKNNR